MIVGELVSMQHVIKSTAPWVQVTGNDWHNYGPGCQADFFASYDTHLLDYTLSHSVHFILHDLVLRDALDLDVDALV